MDVPERFAAAPRYPAMFHVAGGRLVWDGNRLVPVRGDGTPVPAAGRPVVTVTGAGLTCPTVVVAWPAPSGDRARGPAAPDRLGSCCSTAPRTGSCASLARWRTPARTS
ncbi:hypothetical protein [Cellulosimicrobium sp. CUA-896]|uniref:hypothetical protein n=1 Tax=Cellulosimicrobium sp. CUA-896 TaxID=1517881 RepID=UPI00096364F9|nr:hypothetical protein [Cellulosimicrobium sp. CUA-896]OLT49509.1 hypothetical protein BJF88_16105 [Cellulosimicrobium sp. CUA-896]